MPSEHQLSLWRRWSYGVGHVLNDLCASMWFSYLLVFYHFVIKFPNATAGLLLLIGQTVDALCTPVIGYFCDKTRCFYGRRKIWHLVGTICVAASFSFIFHVCITCEDVPVPYLVLYYACFIAVFQFGWASTQISHLALIPDLTSDKNEQVGLNSIRWVYCTCFHQITLVVCTGMALQCCPTWQCHLLCGSYWTMFLLQLSMHTRHMEVMPTQQKLITVTDIYSGYGNTIYAKSCLHILCFSTLLWGSLE